MSHGVSVQGGYVLEPSLTYLTMLLGVKEAIQSLISFEMFFEKGPYVQI